MLPLVTIGVGYRLISVGKKKMSTGDIGELRDKAAAVIGQYMLKGYRMLASHCSDCGVRRRGSGLARVQKSVRGVCSSTLYR